MLQYVEQRMKVFSRVEWLDLGGRGCYITSIGSTNFHNSPTPIGRRHQPPIYRLQPEGIYNSLNSQAPIGKRLQPPRLHAPTRRKLQLLRFSSTNWKEAPTPFPCPFLPPKNINERINLSMLLSSILIHHYHQNWFNPTTS